MFDFVMNAGWPIYLVVGFGVAALGAAARYFVSPHERRLMIVRSLMGLTGLSGILGTVFGVQMSANAIHATPEKWIFLVGLQESLNNASAALVLVMLTMLVTLAARMRNPPPAQNADQIDTVQVAS